MGPLATPEHFPPSRAVTIWRKAQNGIWFPLRVIDLAPLIEAWGADHLMVDITGHMDWLTVKAPPDPDLMPQVSIPVQSLYRGAGGSPGRTTRNSRVNVTVFLATEQTNVCDDSMAPPCDGPRT
jgi:hypothetical protein